MSNKGPTKKLWSISSQMMSSSYHPCNSYNRDIIKYYKIIASDKERKIYMKRKRSIAIWEWIFRSNHIRVNATWTPSRSIISQSGSLTRGPLLCSTNIV
jgi:hypothetical protein